MKKWLIVVSVDEHVTEDEMARAAGDLAARLGREAFVDRGPQDVTDASKIKVEYEE